MKVKNILSIFIFFIAILITACSDNAQQEASGEDIGVVKFYYDSGRYLDVLTEAETLSAETLNNPELRFIIAETYLQIGHPEEAYEIFVAVSKVQHSIPDLQLWIVEALLKQGNLSEARKLLLAEEVVTLHGQQPRYFLLHGQIDLAEGRLNAAKTMFSRLIEDDEDYGLAQVWLARIDLANNRELKASERLERVLQFDNKLAEAWLLLANIKFNKGQYTDAENYYLQTLKLDKSRILTQQSLQVAQNVVRSKVSLGNVSASETFYQDFLESYPKSPIYHFELAKMAYSAEDLSLAEEHLKEVLKISSNNPRVISLLAIILFKQSKFEELESILGTHISNSRNGLDLLVIKAVLDMQLGDNLGAIERINSYIIAEEEDKIALTPLLAYINYRNQDEAQYENILNNYDITNPKSISDINIIYNMFFVLGKNDQAEELLNLLINYYPNSIDLKVLYLNSLNKIGNTTEATQTIKSWLIEQPNNTTLKLVVISHYIAQQKFSAAISELRSMLGTGLSASEKNLLYNNLKSLVIKADSSNERSKISALLKSWQQALPDQPQLGLMLADLYISESNYKNAILHYEILLKSLPNNYVVLNNLAWSYFKVNDKRALEFAERAYAINPNDAPVSDTLGWILAESGQLERGLQLVEQALEIDPENQAIREHLISIQSRLEEIGHKQ